MLPERVVHAGGALWGRDASGVYRQYIGANALEGLRLCADSGADAVELDFSFTADGELVAIHDWSDYYIAGVGEGVPLTREQFEEARIFGCFTPLTLEDAAAFFREHEEMMLVTDIKENFSEAAGRIAAACGDFLDRVVMQIYAEEQYEIAASLGFSRVAYTLYALPWEKKLDTAAHLAFAGTHPLLWIACDASLCENGIFLDAMLASGVPLYVHTVNERKMCEKLLDSGICGVYTDLIG
ncbi:MAG: hypothetical protein IJC71_08250 [Clostridia bacterium]|nr:hypothetical protein [Clostridia bacterium]